MLDSRASLKEDIVEGVQEGVLSTLNESEEPVAYKELEEILDNRLNKRKANRTYEWIRSDQGEKFLRGRDLSGSLVNKKEFLLSELGTMLTKEGLSPEEAKKELGRIGEVKTEKGEGYGSKVPIIWGSGLCLGTGVLTMLGVDNIAPMFYMAMGIGMVAYAGTKVYRGQPERKYLEVNADKYGETKPEVVERLKGEE